MSEQNQNLEEFKKHVLYAYNLYNNQDKNIVEIKRILIEKGFPEVYADQVLKAMNNLGDPEEKRNKNGLYVGIALLAIGIALTIIFPGKIFYGAVLVGLFYVGRALLTP